MSNMTLATADQSAGSIHDSQQVQVTVVAEPSAAAVQATDLAERLAQSRHEVRDFLAHLS